MSESLEECVWVAVDAVLPLGAATAFFLCALDCDRRASMLNGRSFGDGGNFSLLEAAEAFEREEEELAVAQHAVLLRRRFGTEEE